MLSYEAVALHEKQPQNHSLGADDALLPHGLCYTSIRTLHRAVGRYQAATAVAVIAAKGEAIRSPGGYLRGMSGRARNGELHLSNSLWGIARRDHSMATYDA